MMDTDSVLHALSARKRKRYHELLADFRPVQTDQQIRICGGAIDLKNTHICPKCDGSDIIRIEGSVRAYGAGNNIEMGTLVVSTVKVHRYLCCECGFSEEWIDKEDIAKIKEGRNPKG